MGLQVTIYNPFRTLVQSNRLLQAQEEAQAENFNPITYDLHFSIQTILDLNWFDGNERGETRIFHDFQFSESPENIFFFIVAQTLQRRR